MGRDERITRLEKTCYEMFRVGRTKDEVLAFAQRRNLTFSFPWSDELLKVVVDCAEIEAEMKKAEPEYKPPIASLREVK